MHRCQLVRALGLRSSTWRRGAAVAAVMASLSVLPPTAHADACVDGTTYDATSCDGGGASMICTQTGIEWDCDTGLHGTSYAAEAHAIYNISDARFEIFGTDGTNTAFCCVLYETSSPPSGWVLNLYGTPKGDTLGFHYYDGSTSHDLRNKATGDLLEGDLWGYGGDDTMQGSDNSGVAPGGYGENLWGGDGDDLIYAGYGDDDVYDNDVLCGGDEYSLWDYLYGGPGGDKLWGYTASGNGPRNTGDGGSGYDYCDTTSSPGYSLCEATLSSAPAECP